MIWHQVAERIETAATSDAVVVGDERISYGALGKRVAAAAATLPAPVARPARALVRQKEPLAILVSTLACWYRGLVPVVLREGMTDLQVAEMTEWLRPVAVIDGPLPDDVDGGPVVRATPLGPRDEGLVICTSGTTGRPKLVALPAE